MYSIEEIPLTDDFSRALVEKFLSENGLGFEACGRYFALTDEDGQILAGAGLDKDLVKCVAVSESLRGDGSSNVLISRIISVAAESGIFNLKVITKPSNREIFESLGFKCIGVSSKAIMLENGGALDKYLRSLEAHRVEGRAGVIVLNANPLTWGHDYLVQAASQDCDKLFLIPVGDERQMFSYPERLQALCSAFLENLKVDVLEGSPYTISRATFPSYFLKSEDEAAKAQMELDIDIFTRHIAPALGATIRYVGSEPTDKATAAYNDMLAAMLPSRGMELVQVARLAEDGSPISASAVRKALSEGSFIKADMLAHPESMPMMLRHLAVRALRMELDLPSKPGLVCPDGKGSHKDMDYALMLRSLDAIGPYFHYFASINPDDDVHKDMIQTGLDAEKAMLEATGGVNTHRGAIFALGLMCTAFALCYWDGETVTPKVLRKKIIFLSEGVPRSKDSHGALAAKKYKAKGALQNAREGYPALFNDWLPFWRGVKGRENALMLTLMKIMSSLEDTNILYRKGPQALDTARKMAAEAVRNPLKTKACKSLFESKGISPGGSADMLALTILADSLLP
ncbi:MAG: triphosphoribosyl-dephospho-CoA synthase [Bacteroidales bacterium]|nr:triphosphoribosyl-dephospho-CoA synthase [Bacteroidales bacterium]